LTILSATLGSFLPSFSLRKRTCSPIVEARSQSDFSGPRKWIPAVEETFKKKKNVHDTASLGITKDSFSGSKWGKIA
jgi:hypothetical protein